jgi:hypothetical protein
MALTKAQIGRCGEIYVQFRLLLLEIESAPMTTDTGIDLVAYSSKTLKPHTIQVKTNARPKPGGGKGKTLLDWWLPHQSTAQLIALVDLSENRVWMLRAEEVERVAQQRSSEKFHIYMYTDPTHVPKKKDRLAHLHEFHEFLLENRANALFDA